MSYLLTKPVTLATIQQKELKVKFEKIQDLVGCEGDPQKSFVRVTAAMLVNQTRCG